MSFTLDLSNWVAKAKGNTDLVVRRVTLDIFGRVIQRTPVDTGRLKGNWQFGMNRMPSGELSRLGEAAPMRDVNSGVPVKAAGNVYYLVNNLPYAQRIEEGYSKQAPQGMVGLTVMEFGQAVRKATGGLI